MSTPLKVVSLIALLLTIVPGIVLWMGGLSLDIVKICALIGTIGWFAATPLWMGRALPIDAAEVEI